MNKLSVRLIAAFVAVILVGTVITYAFAHQRVNRQFQTYLRGRDQVHAAALAPVFADYYRQNQSWDGIQSAAIGAVDAQIDGEGSARHGQGRGAGKGGFGGYGMGGWAGDNVLLLDAFNRVVFATDTDKVGQTLVLQDTATATAISVNGELVGRLLIYSDSSGPEAALTNEFAAGLNRGVLVAAVVAGIAAILLATLLVRQIVAPLHRLQAAANAITAGDLSQRVPTLTSDELGDVGKSFNQMAARLERDEIMRRNMMADIAHELRTPLTVVQGQVEALLDGVFPMETQQLTPIHDQVILLNRLVSDLRDLALADSGHLHLSTSWVDSAALVSSAAAAIEPMAKEQSVVLTVTHEPDLPLIQWDEQRLRQVLNNLLTNALRHTPAGGKVDIEVQQIPTDSTSRGDYVTITVADTGAGIEEQDLPHIFDRFYRSNSSRQTGIGGTGLGLTIARSIVEAHGGQISATSENRRGTCFAFTLPIETGSRPGGPQPGSIEP